MCLGQAVINFQNEKCLGLATVTSSLGALPPERIATHHRLGLVSRAQSVAIVGKERGFC